MLLACLLANTTWAAEFRQPQRIPTAERGLNPVAYPVARELIVQAVAAIYAHYNQPDFYRLLAKDFYDGQRLADNLIRELPRDAELNLLSINDTRVLQQKAEGYRQVSLVSVVALGQLQYTDNNGQLVRLEGEQELYVRIYQPLFVEQ